MSDPVIKGVIDAIAESDNEAAGQLITRLREAHIHGRDDGQLDTALPTRLVSPVSVFTIGDVGKFVDLIVPAVGAAHGFEGSYIVDSFVDGFNVTLTKIDATAPSFTDTDPVRWRFSTLRVESALELKQRDRQLRVWVGEEPDPIYYAQLVQTAGAQEIRGLGPNRLYVYGDIDSTAPSTISTVGSFFVASDVGKALYVLPLGTPNGNEGPQLITAVDVVAGKFCTVSPGGLSTDEELVWFVVKDYETDAGYLTGLRPPTLGRRELEEQSPVVDGSQSFSGLDQVRRAMLTDYAAGDELDRIGRNLAVVRPLGMGDETYRCLLQTLSYLPKTTVYGLELLLGCLFPGGGFEIYEDLINFPNLVFILLESLAGDSVEFEGKGFLAPTGADITPSIDPSKAGGTALGRLDREKQTSATTTTVTAAHTPISVVDVVRDEVINALDMDSLPSADSPVWTYSSAAAAIEASVFSVSGGTLSQTQPGAPTNDGGRYTRTLPLNEMASAFPGSFFQISWWFRVSTLSQATLNRPWGVFVADDTIDAQYGVWWSQTALELSSTVQQNLTTATFPRPLVDGQWYRFSLVRRSERNRQLVSVLVDGQPIISDVDSTVFGATTVNVVEFGYFFQNLSAQDWTVEWDDFRITARDNRNFYDVSSTKGVSSATGPHLLDVTTSPFVVGDQNKHLRIISEGAVAAARINIGLWNIKTVVAANQVELEGIVSGPLVSVVTVGSDNFVDLLDPYFVADDLSKQIELAGSAAGNNGARKVLEVISSKRARVDGAAYVVEDGLTYKFNPFDGTTPGQFIASTDVVFQVIGASSFVGPALTLRDALPAATTPVQIWYTSVLSAQVLRDEFVVNDGSTGAEPNIYYPLYIFDVDRATRALIDEVTAAGVLSAYEREF